MIKPTLQCPCDRRVGATSFSYNAPPLGETVFDLRGQDYRRSYWCCGLCGHEFAQHALDLSGLYGGTYVEQTYGDRMHATFERILALPPEQSDNAGRVHRVVSFAANHFPPGHIPTLLDVGAGLGIFSYQIKQAGWACTALDPDPRAGRHLADVVGVRAVSGDFFAVDLAELGRFDVVTFNKVIEHVEDPVSMLAKGACTLNSSGIVYVEVPDVAAAIDGPGREEFFIEHHHVFSPASLAMLIDRSGLILEKLIRLREPSGKYTLCAFARLP